MSNEDLVHRYSLDLEITIKVPGFDFGVADEDNHDPEAAIRKWFAEHEYLDEDFYNSGLPRPTDVKISNLKFLRSEK